MYPSQIRNRQETVIMQNARQHMEKNIHINLKKEYVQYVFTLHYANVLIFNTLT